MVTNILQGLIAVLIIGFYFWLKPKLTMMESIVNMYKGFGTDYANWKKQHDDEYMKLEQQLSQVKSDIVKHKKAIKDKEKVSQLEVSINRIIASIDGMRQFRSMLESIESFLRGSDDDPSWLAQAFRANRVVEFVVDIRQKYEESIKEGQGYIDSIGKKDT